jgi:hypothetical protein
MVSGKLLDKNWVAATNEFGTSPKYHHEKYSDNQR